MFEAESSPDSYVYRYVIITMANMMAINIANIHIRLSFRKVAYSSHDDRQTGVTRESEWTRKEAVRHRGSIPEFAFTD
jgi:hypothetical protein